MCRGGWKARLITIEPTATCAGVTSIVAATRGVGLGAATAALAAARGVVDATGVVRAAALGDGAGPSRPPASTGVTHAPRSMLNTDTVKTRGTRDRNDGIRTVSSSARAYDPR